MSTPIGALRPAVLAVIEEAAAKTLFRGTQFILEPHELLGEIRGHYTGLVIVAWCRCTLDCLCVVGWTAAAPERSGNYLTGCAVYTREQLVTAVAA
jgi:hypothetical protein